MGEDNQNYAQEFEISGKYELPKFEFSYDVIIINDKIVAVEAVRQFCDYLTLKLGKTVCVYDSTFTYRLKPSTALKIINT